MVTVFVQAITPILLLAALGIFLTKKTPYLDSPHLGTLVSNVGLPALLLHSVLTMNMDFAGMLKIIFATVSVLACVALIAWITLRLVGLPSRFYLPPLVNPNTGNLGIPIAYALFGEAGLAVAVVVSSVVQVSHFTLGVGWMSGEYRPLQLIKNGPVIALLVGGCVLLTPWQLPLPIMDTLELVSSMTLPIMLMLLGKSLAGLSLANKGMLRRACLLGVLRPTLGATVAALIVPWFDFKPLEEATMIALQGMSVAVISYLLASKYNGPKDEIALMIVISLPISLSVAGAVWWWY